MRDAPPRPLFSPEGPHKLGPLKTCPAGRAIPSDSVNCRASQARPSVDAARPTLQSWLQYALSPTSLSMSYRIRGPRPVHWRHIVHLLGREVVFAARRWCVPGPRVGWVYARFPRVPAGQPRAAEEVGPCYRSRLERRDPSHQIRARAAAMPATSANQSPNWQVRWTSGCRSSSTAAYAA